MKNLRNALLAGFLILILSFVFSSITASTASAQQDEVSPAQAPDQEAQTPDQTLAPPPPDQGQTYDKPDAGQAQVAPDQPQDQGAYDKPDAGRPMEIPDESASATANEPSNEMANGQSEESDRNDPPGRVARLQYTSGSVSIQPHGTDQWVQGSVNRPLTIADNVWADKDSRAELNVGTGLIRIGSETSLTLTNVSDNSVQLSLHQGAMNVYVRHLYSGEIYEVDTPNQAFTILKTGDYRFDVDPNADTTLVTVWHGEGESTGQGESVRIKEHQQARFSNGNSLAHEIHAAPPPDGFDDWCEVRDRREDDSVSARYVSPDVIGSEDLDANGTWRDTPQYGHVWVPNQVDPGWAPYTDGQWIYESPWGWTWDDYAPWGFAPFHYGRWVTYGGGWGWAPGPYYGGWDRGYYAPALVAWFGGGGWGGGFGFGFGGGFGWCPLGWGEPFIPWYHAGWGYFRNVNIYNTRINNINGFRGGFRNGFANRGGFRYANMNARGGFTAVSRGTLQRGLPVRQNEVHVSANAVRNAPALNRVNASPTMQSRLGRNAGRPAATPGRMASRPVVSRMTSSAASRSNSFGSSRAGVNQGGIRSTQSGRQTGFARTSNGQGAMASRNVSNAGRSVPRPPQSFGQSNNSAGARSSFSGNSRGANSSMSASRNVPRPPAGGTASQRSSSSYRGAASSQQFDSRSGASSGGYRNNVPRPTGRVLSAPRSYSSGGNSSGYSSRSYSGSSGRYSSSGYGGSSRYNGSSYGGRSYGGSSYGRSSSPYSGRSYSGSSYGGGRSYSRSSYGGGGGRSYSSGGGRSSGGGGGHSSGGGSRGGGGSHGSSHGGGHR